jgi:hypothetical protein
VAKQILVGDGGFEEARCRQERDKKKVRELTGILQTIHGLIDAEDHGTLAIASGVDEAKVGERVGQGLQGSKSLCRCG